MITKIIKFGSKTCAPCKAMDTILKDFNTIPIQKVDISTEESEELMRDYNVKNIPTLIFVDELGIMIDKSVGMTSLMTIKDIINKHNL